ncbi:MAG TPA: radical SAM protein [Syntrophales bacterium]|nr:radical SAM protein [Syntrophales bacterium]HON99129.1 radical SAM protein [Syntrophales bacterium]HRV41775.1 radical SAM protein [Syntrophales bacterium]
MERDLQCRTFEQGPIRPPSEAKSLLIRATRNCPWNRCAFCHSYEGARFSLRTREEVEGDIRTAKAVADEIREISWRMGRAGRIDDAVLRYIYGRQDTYGDAHRSVAAWLYFGGTSVFLQDADSLVMKTDDLAAIISLIRSTFPTVERITTYCRSKTASRKSVEELRRLKEAGLSRVHIGLESGSDEVLKFVRKGVTAAEHIEGGRRVVEAGLSLSEYVIPGLGGEAWSKVHAEETARVLNAIGPRFIRLRTLQIVRNTLLYEKLKKGEFTPLDDEAVLAEIRLLLENLEGIESTVVSDHILNLLEEVTGRLPEDKERMLGVIDAYFALPKEDRLVFRIGRRRGIYRSLADLEDRVTYERLRGVLAAYEGGEGDLERDLRRLMHQYI